jgi:hypothetical protein
MELKNSDILTDEFELGLGSGIRFVPDRERLGSFPHSIHLGDLLNAAKTGDSGKGDREGEYLPNGLRESPLPRGPVEPLDSARLQRFEHRIATVERGHSLFRTDGGDFGMGRVSAAAGDEVWILLGGEGALCVA